MPADRFKYLQNKEILDDVSNIKPLNNHVLVKSTINTEKTKSGIYVDKDWNRANHVDRIQEVVAIPDSLIYNDPTNNKSSEWNTEIEVKPGDIVIADYMDVSDSQWFTDRNMTVIYRFIPYTGIYCIKRDTELYPLNGYVILSKIKKEKRLLSYSKKELIETEGILEYIGKRNKSYTTKTRSDATNIKIGDRVSIEPIRYTTTQIDLESEFHNTTGRHLFIVQSWRLQVVLESR